MLNMNIVTSNNAVEPRYSTELTTFSSPDTLSSVAELQHRRIVADNNDALEAVKLDPAVLEARVIIDSSQDAYQKPVATTAEGTRGRQGFEQTVRAQQAALLSLTPQQYELLLQFAATLRRQRLANQVSMECAFCKNNGEPRWWYASHALRSWRGRVRCPVLRACRCPRCGATGDVAHTAKYCPDNILADLCAST